MDDIIRLGTIGSGFIVDKVLEAVRDTAGISLYAVYSRSLDRANAIKEKYGAKNIYDDLEAFLADKEINFVYIASPNSLHFAQAKLALARGKNVVCEKPICSRLADALELTQLAKARELFLFEAVTIPYLPGYDYLRRYIGEIGRVRLVISNYGNRSVKYDALLAGELPNVFNPAFDGGCLLDMNFYNVYLNIILFGEPKDVHYYANLHNNGIDTSGTVILQYDDFVSSSSASKDAFGENFFLIEGENGKILIHGSCNELSKVDIGCKNYQVNYEDKIDQRWKYEINGIVSLFSRRDLDKCYQYLSLSTEVVEILEICRRTANVVFPADSP